MPPLIISIDGVSLSGKTTAARAVAQANDGVLMIEEHFVYNNGMCIGESFDKRSQKSQNEAAEKLCNLENLRFLSIPIVNDFDLIILDSSYRNCIAYDYARSKIDRSINWINTSRLFINSSKIVPDKIVFIDTHIDEIIKRGISDGVRPGSIRLNREFQFYFRQYFLDVASHECDVIFLNPFDLENVVMRFLDSGRLECGV